MRFGVLAFDCNGTIAEDGNLDSDAKDVIAEVRGRRIAVTDVALAPYLAFVFTLRGPPTGKRASTLKELAAILADCLPRNLTSTYADTISHAGSRKSSETR